MREKLKNIEILRFVFIIEIVLMHLTCSQGLLKLLSFDQHIIGGIRRIVWHAYVGVDYFFIISGFFLCYTFKNIHSHQFLLRKIKRFLPTLLVSLLMLFILSCYYPDIKFDWIKAFYTITFTGSFTPAGVGYSWFIGPLFWASLFYFYTLKHFDKKYLNILFSIIVICSYTMLINNTSNNFPNVRPQLYRFLNIGVLRALAGMGIGYFVAMFYSRSLRKLRDVDVPRLRRVLFTVGEALLLFFIVYYGSSHLVKRPNPMIFVFAFSALLILFLLKWGYISRILDNNLSVFLGKYVFTIYVLDETIQHYLRHVIPTVTDSNLYGGGVFILLILICYVSLGMVVYHCLKIIDRLYEKYCSNNCKGGEYFDQK